MSNTTRWTKPETPVMVPVSELRAAAERVRRVKYGESQTAVYGGKKQPLELEPGFIYEMEDANALAACAHDEDAIVTAYLAEHDPTPLDEASFRRLTGCEKFTKVSLGSGYWLVLKSRQPTSLMLIHDDLTHELPLPHIKTVGQFTNLLVALTGKECA